MTLRQQVLADASKFIAERGEPIVYHSASLGALTRCGIFTPGTGVIRDEHGRAVQQHGELEVSRDAAAGVSAWAESDWVTFTDRAAERWEVVGAAREDPMGHVMTLTLQRDTPVRYAGAGHEKGPS